MSDMAYTVHSAKNFADTLKALEEAATAAGWTALGVHDMKARFDKKGIAWEGQISIFEMCNANFASQMALADPRFVLHMPCRAVVRELEDGVVEVSILQTTYVASLFGDEYEEMAAHVGAIVQGIIDSATA
ncbi:MAG TPA: DUF302 domain-containing protein [Coriobacteriia bacterium]|nr:DUF302 domain-containing protein [Coriobacteriia bacterium]